MILKIIVCYLLQVALTIGIVFLFGFLIAICNKLFYANFGNYGKTVCYITGAIGTPLHECSHALFCMIFGHRITEIKLFQINSDDGTLGYVNHSYNPKNIYHRIGNFFIGIAPIVVISSLLYLIAYFLIPNFISNVNVDFDINNYKSSFGSLFVGLFETIKSFFLCATTWQWWVFLFAGMLLALHMTLSTADIKGALDGLLFVLIALLIVDIVLGVVKSDLLGKFTIGVLKASSYLLTILTLALIISAFSLAISFAFRLLRRGKTN